MPVLKEVQYERFAQEMVKNPGNQADAYVRAGGKPKGARTMASRWLKRKDISARIVEIQNAGAKLASVTAQDIARDLDEARALAIKQKMPSAMVSASMGKAKVLGLIVDKSIQLQKPLKDMNKAELKAFLGEA